MDSILQDLRFALRSMLRAPGFSAIVVITLALGIGANTAIFTVLDRALLRPLPIRAPEQVFRVWAQRGPDNLVPNFSYPKTAEIAGVDAFQGAFAYQEIALALTAAGSAERISAAGVSASFFDVLGLVPAHGRGFAEGEDRLGASPNVVVLGDALWRRRFGGDPAIVGRTVQLNGRTFDVIGIAPPGFAGLTRGAREDAWIPLPVAMEFEGLTRAAGSYRSTWLNVFVRLAPGYTQASANEALAALDRSLAERGHQPANHATHLREGARGMDWLVADYRKPLMILMVVVGGVLLIACANVANLLLARASARGREVAVRLSLGASRARLTRQLLTESVLLAAMGGVAGLLVAGWLQDILLAFRPVGGEAFVIDDAPDRRVLLFTLGITMLTGVLFGLAPSLRASRPALIEHLKDGAAGASESRGFGLRGVLVVAQVALSLVLLVGTGLFVRSLRNLQAVDIGFAPSSSVLVASFDLRQAGYTPERGQVFAQQLTARLAGLPGVASASLGRSIPPTPGGENWGGSQLDGSPVEPEAVSFDVNAVGLGYFETMDIRLLRGRSFTATDQAGAPRVAIVNEAMAARYWPGQDVIGRRISVSDSGRGAPWVEIVGVVRDGKYRRVRATNEVVVFFPLAQYYKPQLNLIVRGTRSLPSLALVQGEVRALDASLPLSNIRTLRDQVDMALGQDRMIATLALLFGGLALALAAVGLFGVMAFDTTRRFREIGVRMALGARPSDVLGQVVGRGFRLVMAGLVLGAVSAVFVSRFAASLLYGVTPADPIAFAGAAFVLLLVSLLASWLPARRAAAVDPMIALRND